MNYWTLITTIKNLMPEPAQAKAEEAVALGPILF